MVRGWHVRKDVTAAKRGLGWPRFPSLLRWPLPPDGEDSGDAASDAARFYSTPLSPETQDEMEAERAPPPALTVFFKDVGGSKILLLLKTDWWFGWAKMQTFSHQAAGSSDAALRERYRVALADFVETHDARRRGGAFPANLSKTKTSIWKGSNLPTSSFGAFVDAIADNVFP